MTTPEPALTNALLKVREAGYVLSEDWPRHGVTAQELGLHEDAGTVRLPADVHTARFALYSKLVTLISFQCSCSTT